MIVFSSKIKKIFAIEQFIEEKVSVFIPYLFRSSQKFAGWGRKPSFFRAQQAAQQHHVTCVCLEDGFIRSLGLGKAGYQPLSLVIDQIGIYFDATQASDLENLILTTTLSEEQYTNAQQLIQKIVDVGITKYNLPYDPIEVSQFQQKKNILVVDQTYGDQSIAYAMASADHFQQMLQQAIAEHPDANIWVKIHPDVLAGKAKSHFSIEQFQAKNVKLLTENYNPIDLCKQMSEVYVVSSQLGFEALLCAKKVHCFGVPWYAAWGLTQDRHPEVAQVQVRRNVSRSLEQLFVAAYLHYAKYVSPVSQQRCDLNEIVEILEPNIAFQKQLPKGQVVAYGFSRWKRKFIRDYLAFPQLELQFKSWSKPKKNQPVVAWGKKAALLKQQGFQQVWTVEDGFLRSLGLGAKLIRPFSLVFDDVGIYYDATRPSRLEQLLNRVQLSAVQKQRIQQLRQQIIENKLTKYNVGQQQATALAHIDRQKKVILVVGQVEDDLSIQLGGIDIKSNLALIQEVRKNHPDAYIIYKPHPDVEAGLRKGKIAWEDMQHLVDCVEKDVSIITLFEYIDELHTITSLSGFEALLRNITVYCYGMPFYAGWGITIDRHQCQRRQRNLSIDELAFSVLIEYPVYNLPHTSQLQVPLVTPEHVLEHICQLQQMTDKSSLNMMSWVFTRLRELKIKF